MKRTVGAEDQLSELSRNYLRHRPKAERSSLGQFLTPRDLRQGLLDKVDLWPGIRILDPGVGTGEFLKDCLTREPGADCHGWDIDPEALGVASQLVPSAELSLRSALDAGRAQLTLDDPSPDIDDGFDLVIGNPPYFEIRDLSAELRQRFSDVISGRPNIFSLFFKVGLDLLRPGGQLAFVVPPSMNNGAYFERLRAYILASGGIEYLKVFDDPHLFEEVQTAVQLIVIRKGEPSSKHWCDLAQLSGSTRRRKIFAESPHELAAQFEGRSTLHSLGYEAHTGTVVWNQRRDQLRQAEEPGAVPLFWAHNIDSDSDEVVLVPDHPKRPQFVVGVTPETGPAIIVNRITGSVGAGSLRCALVPPGMRFVAENHVNVVKPLFEGSELVQPAELLERLRAPAVTSGVRMLTGNTQVSATELTHWIPV